jgi:hypothetical protein
MVARLAKNTQLIGLNSLTSMLILLSGRNRRHYGDSDRNYRKTPTHVGFHAR